MKGLTCRELIGFLDDYVAGTQDPAVRAAFEGHLGMCKDCRDYLGSYRETIRLSRWACGCTDPVPADVPPGLVEAILKARNAKG